MHEQKTGKSQSRSDLFKKSHIMLSSEANLNLINKGFVLTREFYYTQSIDVMDAFAGLNSCSDRRSAARATNSTAPTGRYGPNTYAPLLLPFQGQVTVDKLRQRVNLSDQIHLRSVTPLLCHPDVFLSFLAFVYDVSLHRNFAYPTNFPPKPYFQRKTVGFSIGSALTHSI